MLETGLSTCSVRSSELTAIPESDLELVETFCYETEKEDRLDINEITVQFVAYTPCSNHGNLENDIDEVYFSLQFYRFPEIKTERMRLGKMFEYCCVIQPTSCCRELQPSEPKAKRGTLPERIKVAGCQVTFIVDPNSMYPGEYEEFFGYLLYNSLQLEVWDAQSHMLLGSSSVELQQLCRQQKPMVEMTLTVEVISNKEFDVQSGQSPAVEGHLHLRLSNLGRDSGTPKEQTVAFEKDSNRYLVGSHLNHAALGFKGGALSAAATRNLEPEPQTSEFGTLVRARALKTLSAELRELLKEAHASIVSTNEERKQKLVRFYAATQEYHPGHAELSGDNSNEFDKSVELSIIARFRNQKKRRQIEQMLSLPTVVAHRLNTSFGCTEFFEIELCNASDEEDIIYISTEGDSNAVEIVLNSMEVNALKRAFGVCTPTEIDLFVELDKSNGPAVSVQPGETVRIPIKYKALSVHEAIEQYKVDFISAKTNETINQLQLQVNISRPIIDRTFRFFAPELTYCKKISRLPAASTFPLGPEEPKHRKKLQHLSALASDPSILVQCKTGEIEGSNDLFVKVGLGKSPEIRDFLVAVYIEPHMIRPEYLWRWVIHALQHVEVVTTLGQGSPQIDLSFRTQDLSLSDWPRQMSIHISQKEEMKLGMKMSTVLDEEMLSIMVPLGVYEFKAKIYPRRTGTHQYLIHLVDEASERVVWAWIVRADIKPPKVTKSFEIELPLVNGRGHRVVGGCNKRVSYTNPYPEQKRLYLFSDRPDLIQFKERQLDVAAKGTVQLGLRFTPQSQASIQRLFVFIKDTNLDGKTEETLSIAVHYR